MTRFTHVIVLRRSWRWHGTREPRASHSRRTGKHSGSKARREQEGQEGMSVKHLYRHAALRLQFSTLLLDVLLEHLDWSARSVHHRSVHTVRWSLQVRRFLLAPVDAVMIPLYSSEDLQTPVLSHILGFSLFRFTDGIDFARG